MLNKSALADGAITTLYMQRGPRSRKGLSRINAVASVYFRFCPGNRLVHSLLCHKLVIESLCLQGQTRRSRSLLEQLGHIQDLFQPQRNGFANRLQV